MKKPEKPANEPLRIQTLNQLGLLDTEPDPKLDRLTEFVAHVFCVPVALISLVDSERQWFKSKVGLDACETSRDISFCGHAILDPGVFVVANTLKDGRFKDNPLVTGPPYIRFYAGAPLILENGSAIGTLCLIDIEPRTFDEDDIKVLREVADKVVNEFC
ncbi:GAF domain-containing protein [Pseudoalteromonas sp. JBTF-M23]|uniref:GAF domain-containing protein n=1 Tax=Pseudoalteromonas caenipelagi TaxID=2726988 RepID=A0A849VEE0_9GAMM|nr:GAF domain-containing protein [Pseudoalteromonas caenipelagi]NOU50071.1 GAF domain-containing protein [Pseudoalteromonas caenipelagi]